MLFLNWAGPMAYFPKNMLSARESGEERRAPPLNPTGGAGPTCRPLSLLSPLLLFFSLPPSPDSSRTGMHRGRTGAAQDGHRRRLDGREWTPTMTVGLPRATAPGDGTREPENLGVAVMGRRRRRPWWPRVKHGGGDGVAREPGRGQGEGHGASSLPPRAASSTGSTGAPSWTRAREVAAGGRRRCRGHGAPLCKPICLVGRGHQEGLVHGFNRRMVRCGARSGPWTDGDIHGRNGAEPRHPATKRAEGFEGEEE